MSKEYIADKATLDNVNSIVSALNNRWPDARVGKVDNIQAVLNTPDGNTLAAWIQSISNSAANAYNKANEANNNAANAANLASQANSNAWNAYQEAINAKNAAGGISTIRVPIKFDAIQLNHNSSSCMIFGKGKAVIGSDAYTNLKIKVDGNVICDRNQWFGASERSSNENIVFLEVDFLSSFICDCYPTSGGSSEYALVKYLLY